MGQVEDLKKKGTDLKEKWEEKKKGKGREVCEVKLKTKERQNRNIKMRI